MKKIFLTIALSLILGISASAQTNNREVTDSVTFMPDKAQIHEGITKNGNPKYWIELPTETGTRKVSMTESHVNSGRLLALIERKDKDTGRYYYSIKFAEHRRTSRTGEKADLSSLK